MTLFLLRHVEQMRVVEGWNENKFFSVTNRIHILTLNYSKIQQISMLSDLGFVTEN